MVILLDVNPHRPSTWQFVNATVASYHKEEPFHMTDNILYH